MYDENFKKNFKDVNRQEIGKEFHKNMKNFTGYTATQTIADLEEGPFISDKDQEKLDQDEKNIETIKILTNKEDIEIANIEWQRIHFQSDKQVKYNTESLITIKEDEVEEAILELEYKNKAHSCDKMLDKIFKKQTYLKILLDGSEFKEVELKKQ